MRAWALAQGRDRSVRDCGPLKTLPSAKTISPSSTVRSCSCHWFQPDAVLGGDQAELPRVRTRPIEAVAVPHRGVVERAVAQRAVRAVRACPRGITASARDSQQMGFDRHGAHCTPGWCLSALFSAAFNAELAPAEVDDHSNPQRRLAGLLTRVRT